MATVTLTFDSIEEQEAILDAINGWKWKMCFNDLDDRLRASEKHSAPFLPLNVKDLSYEQVESLRELLRAICISNNLILNV